jgi:hypothetical protein
LRGLGEEVGARAVLSLQLWTDSSSTWLSSYNMYVKHFRFINSWGLISVVSLELLRGDFAMAFFCFLSTSLTLIQECGEGGHSRP